ncbi:hypothetical protein TNCV_830751 [Trichonephila clavipes]|nr:hypothetical protein TNCV_830751 [Trichonephila clavipes]
MHLGTTFGSPEPASSVAEKGNRAIRHYLAKLREFLISNFGFLFTIPKRIRKGLGSNPGEDVGVCKCIVPSRHGGTLNSRRATSPPVMVVARDEMWEAPNPPPGCSHSKLGRNLAKSYCHLYGAQGYGQAYI